ncbi:MAG: ABC transporter substrate-binding protein [Coriobacteriales bacterium]|nr:ABC transporter substrate-binding protein [Coriobacteriales bacterium]
MSLTMNRRSFLQGGLAASALAALAGCKKSDDAAQGGGDATAAAAGGNVLKFYISNPVAIDPYNTQETQGTQVEHMLFDTLCGFDWDKKEVVPKAAEKWEVNDDATEFTFHLVQGAKFHNGDPVDAASFKRGWERICDSTMPEPSVIAYHLDPVKGAKEMSEGKATELSGVEVVDENTLKVTLNAPMADFPYVCAHPALAPVPQAALDDPSAFLTAPIGNGPFKMDGSWVADQYINLVRNDDYYGEKAKIDGIYFSIQKDPETAFREFEAGNIDFVDIPTGRMAEIGEKYGLADDGYTVTPGKQALTGPEAGVYYLLLNQNDETLKDPVVRKAISLAINRQNIIDTLFEGTRVAADCIFPRVIDDDASNVWEFCHYDKDAAIKLLDEKYPADSKGKRGIKVSLSYNSDGGHGDLMSIVQGDLEAVGIEVTQDSLEWAAYLKAMGDGTYQVARLGWNADYPTMDNFLYPIFLSTSENNYSKYNNPAVDEALQQARQITDEEKRKQAYRQINKLVGADMPVVPIMFYSHMQVGSDKLKSFYYDPQTKGEFAKAEMA